MADQGRGWALIISEDDHRPEAIAEKLRRLGPDTKLASGARVVSSTRLRQLFGIRPYHILVELQGSQEQLVGAFRYLEDTFSHVDGFEPVM